MARSPPVGPAEELALLIPGALVTIFPGAGHIPLIKEPAAFQNTLILLLQSISTQLRETKADEGI